MKNRNFALKTLFKATFLAIFVVLLTACGSSHVNVTLPEDATTQVGTKVISKNLIVGSVDSIVLTPGAKGTKMATVQFESSKLASTILVDGVRAFVLDDGQIDFDLTQTLSSSKPLAPGTTIIATKRNVVEAVVERWATKSNTTIFAIGALGILIALIAARMFARGVIGLVRIAIACAISVVLAYVASPRLAPLVEEHIYPLLESARAEIQNGSPSANPATPGNAQTTPATDVSTSTPTTSVTDPATATPAESAPAVTPAVPASSTNSPPAAAPTSLIPDPMAVLTKNTANAAKELSERYIDALRTKPLPNPIYLTFFLVWIVSFVVVQSLLGKMLSSR